MSSLSPAWNSSVHFFTSLCSFLKTQHIGHLLNGAFPDIPEQNWWLHFSSPTMPDLQTHNVVIRTKSPVKVAQIWKGIIDETQGNLVAFHGQKDIFHPSHKDFFNSQPNGKSWVKATLSLVHGPSAVYSSVYLTSPAFLCRAPFSPPLASLYFTALNCMWHCLELVL